MDHAFNSPWKDTGPKALRVSEPPCWGLCSRGSAGPEWELRMTFQKSKGLSGFVQLPLRPFQRGPSRRRAGRRWSPWTLLWRVGQW